MASLLPHFLLLCIIFFCCSSSVFVESTVSKTKTFQFKIEGDVNEYYFGGSGENGADYRLVQLKHAFVYPFALYFYNTTPNAFFFGIGATEFDDLMTIRWVWTANLNDHVGDNATLTFGRDGNLVLANADGRIGWQTNTTNKGVTSISMKPSGNLVLHDKKGRFIWQSFQHPTDSLLVGQSLELNSGTKLVSHNLRYSMMTDDKKGLIMLLNTSSKFIQYAGWGAMGLLNATLHAVQRVNLVQPNSDAMATGNTTFFLTLGFAKQTRRVILNTIDSVFTFAFLRLESDGNLRLYAFVLIDAGPDIRSFRAWVTPYAFFGDTVKECALDSKCGSSGKCDRKLCSACPRNSTSGCLITPRRK
ncbi:hypothetical protein C5167_021190 [Papaver somniferum]|uniref:Bulb-type lectin domain-containing protein n=1 Tax=Papaver somniferum TaxID=3469 RepID=A0A4Y7IZC3_PAPSO|nr:EP1-like glycoprotein 2 [Papaver somniferum]RZC52765.1 hypothetical protein C5167_021190 [Papaver somniferum]